MTLALRIAAWSCLLTFLTSVAARAADTVQSPLSPTEALAHFKLEPGLAIELVACEPEVIDPVAIRFDEDGRLWVVEMRDYPHGPTEGQKPLSKIRVLTDRDGDGRYESSGVFAEDLLFPTGIQPWQGGVIVTLAGAVMYLKDTDGDGRADKRDVWYRGFMEENPQLRANHPRLGLDGRITIANGLRGGTIVDARLSESDARPLSISGRDFCFDPRTHAAEAVSGNGQFGLTYDDFGNRFICNNRVPVEHVVLENKYLARNPFLAVAAVVNGVAPAGEQSHVYPLTAAWTTSNLHAGQFTAACGVEIYRGDALGDDYYGNALVCEPTGSLVHREVLAADGVSFVSHAPHEGTEFLATPDSWFRPVNLEIGPDGALYIVDMVRAVIEHPQYMPTELQTRSDLRFGDDRGRIYRVVRAGAKRPEAQPKLSRATSAELAELLRRKNSWWRETAARLLIERQDKSVAGVLKAIAAGGAEPASRVAALWLLANLNALDGDSIGHALADPEARVREQAIVLAEPRLADNADLRKAVMATAADSDARVRFRAALALGGLSTGDVVRPLAEIALARPADVWTRTAVASAVPTHLAQVLATVLASDAWRGKPFDAPELALPRELAATVGASRDERDVATIVLLVGESDSQSTAARDAALLGLAQGLQRRGAALGEFVTRLPDAATLQAKLTGVFARAAEDATNESLAQSVRAGRIDLLAYDHSDRAADALLPIVVGSPSQALRIRAAGALAGQVAKRVGPTLIESFSAQTPAVRRALLDALLAQPDRARLLLDEVEARRIVTGEIDAPRATRLTHYADPALAERARKLLAAPLPAERKRVLDEYRSALDLPADPLSGKKLFREHCATCHHIADVGVDVAPDISDSRVKTPLQLLTDILNPNQAIDNNYVSYTVVMLDGSVHTGIVASESANSITLRQPENKTLELLRADVETMRSGGVSLMPEGLEKQLSRQQMADVISFVKNWRYLDRPIPGRDGAGGK